MPCRQPRIAALISPSLPWRHPSPQHLWYHLGPPSPPPPCSAVRVHLLREGEKLERRSRGRRRCSLSLGSGLPRQRWIDHHGGLLAHDHGRLLAYHHKRAAGLLKRRKGRRWEENLNTQERGVRLLSHRDQLLTLSLHLHARQA